MQGTYSKRLTDEQLDDVVRQYQSGETIHAIAVRYHCSDSVIRNGLKLRRVTMRVGGARPGTTSAGRGYRYS